MDRTALAVTVVCLAVCIITALVGLFTAVLPLDRMLKALGLDYYDFED